MLAAPTQVACYGVVQKSDHTQRTCKVRWMDKKESEGDKKESEGDSQVSVYDIGPHPNYSFKMGDIVVRLVDVNSAENEEHECTQTTPSCGEVGYDN